MYYRFGLHRGTLALPLAVLPVFATELLLSTALGIGWMDTGRGVLPVGGRLAIALAVLVAGLLAARALTRGVAVHPHRGG